MIFFVGGIGLVIAVLHWLEGRGAGAPVTPPPENNDFALPPFPLAMPKPDPLTGSHGAPPEPEPGKNDFGE